MAERRHAVAPLENHRLDVRPAHLQIDQRRRQRRRAAPIRAVAARAGLLVNPPAKLDRRLRSVQLVHGPELVDGRRVVDVDVQDVQERIERSAVPLTAAQMARLCQRALQRRRGEDRSRGVFSEFPQGVFVRGRRDVGEIRLGERLPHEGRRLHGKRLRGPGFLAGHRGMRHGLFDHGKQRLPRVPIQHEDESHLRQLHHHIPGSARPGERDENRRRRIVVVPDVVMHRLVVPLAFAGRRVERQDAVGEQIGAFPKRAVEIVRRRSGRAEYPSAPLVHRDATPRVGAAVVLALHPLPRVVADLALLRDRVEYPLQLARYGVERANMAGRGVVALVHARSDDQEVLEDRAWRRHLETDHRGIHAEVLPQVDPPALAECRDEPARGRLEGVDAIFHEIEDPLTLRALPVRDASVAEPDHGLALVVGRRVETPELPPGGRVQRHGLETRRGQIHHAVHDNRIGVHRGARARVAGVVFPGRLQALNVGGMNLAKRGVLGRAGIAAVDRPIQIVGRDLRLAEHSGRRAARQGSDNTEKDDALLHSGLRMKGGRA